MIAIEIAQPGGPEVLRPVERPVPVPGDGEVLVRVEAAGVNRPDVMQRMGKYPPPPGASDVPGLEIAGTIAALGPAANEGRWRVSDRVCALVAGGGYAEYCVVPSAQCLPIPAGLSMRQAAAVPETFFTVWTNLFQRAGLREGETVLVHGGTSGIGTTAIQLARAFGGEVYATAGTDAKCAACVRLGAKRAINYREEDFVEAIRAATAGRGVDVILDIIGGDYLPRNIDALAMNGRLVQIGLIGGARAAFNLTPVLQRRLTITGSTLRARTVEEKGALAREVETHVWPLLAHGTVAPVIDRTFPLARAADAHRRIESGEHVGKIVLLVQAPATLTPSPRP
ncbi:MAG: NAD(P)H-quinone oxidoreductase [Acidobacteria bacterium RIFCSPLOWO2_02_FULL_67_36]|nr:MAG: NAD(P)H-quinone oxidoreductase [Acidobacteria bacterium RIFCSPLOWO2_02_FULL_67_36]OFW24428.1 MAG: NAD(P)H-quinone oxidoreductase [Acidobacteria bacterium RIFCSPLOWO2_12_FULL_66_21]